jgi:carbon storage regulator
MPMIVAELTRLPLIAIQPSSSSLRRGSSNFSRRVGESLKIGAEVTVTVMGVKGRQVHIGVIAPKDLAVHREEVFERIAEEHSANPPQ